MICKLNQASCTSLIGLTVFEISYYCPQVSRITNSWAHSNNNFKVRHIQSLSSNQSLHRNLTLRVGNVLPNCDLISRIPQESRPRTYFFSRPDAVRVSLLWLHILPKTNFWPIRWCHAKIQHCIRIYINSCNMNFIVCLQIALQAMWYKISCEICQIEINRSFSSINSNGYNFLAILHAINWI